MWAKNVALFFSIPILFCLASLKGKKSSYINFYLLDKNFRNSYIYFASFLNQSSYILRRPQELEDISQFLLTLLSNVK